MRHVRFAGVSWYAPAAIKMAPPSRGLEAIIVDDNNASSCNAHCASAAPALKPNQTVK